MKNTVFFIHSSSYEKYSCGTKNREMRKLNHEMKKMPERKR